MNHIILFLLALNQVFSWDIGILYNDKIELYNKQKLNKTIMDIAFQNMYILVPSYKRTCFTFFNNKFNLSYLMTYKPEYKVYILDGKIENEGSIQSMDIDVDKNLLFWLDIKKDALFKLEIKIGQQNKVGVFLTNFTYEISKDIVVNDVNETIYWIASNRSHSFLITTNYIGFQQDVLVTQKGIMSFLAIDKTEGFLYWSYDTIHGYDIEKYNINTGEIKVVKKNLQNSPCHLKISKKYLFWMDWGTRYIWRSEKNNNFMESYLSFDINAISFVINENTIDDEIKTITIKNIINTTEKNIKVVTMNGSLDDVELNKTYYKTSFKTQSNDNKIKKVIWWFLLMLTICIILVALLIFTSRSFERRGFYGLLNTHPLNNI